MIDMMRGWRGRGGSTRYYNITVRVGCYGLQIHFGCAHVTRANAGALPRLDINVVFVRLNRRRHRLCIDLITYIARTTRRPCNSNLLLYMLSVVTSDARYYTVVYIIIL